MALGTRQYVPWMIHDMEFKGWHGGSVFQIWAGDPFLYMALFFHIQILAIYDSRAVNYSTIYRHDP